MKNEKQLAPVAKSQCQSTRGIGVTGAFVFHSKKCIIAVQYPLPMFGSHKNMACEFKSHHWYLVFRFYLKTSFPHSGMLLKVIIQLVGVHP